jgi:TM2 domain-containing membrane protein YozV
MSVPGDDLSFYASRPGQSPVPPPQPDTGRGEVQPAVTHYPAPYGQHPGAYGQTAAAMAVLGKKSAGLAAVLSLLLVGAGQMYCGRVGRGLAFLVAYAVSVLLIFAFVGFLLMPVVFIWALIDAINLANKHNAELARRLTYGGYGY